MGENTRKDRRTKVLSMTVRYRSATLGEFIEHHSYDVSRGGMFIKTPSPFPPGTLLKFEVKIAEEQRVMQGVGRVVWKRDLDGDSPDDPAGMGIKFIKIDDASRAVIDKLVEGRPPGQEGAFEHLPDAKPRMFPSTPPPAQAVTDDPTVVKPAAELLKDALRKTGEADGDSGPPPSTRGNSALSALSGSNAAMETGRAMAETADLGEVPVTRGSSDQSAAAKPREGSKRDSAKDNQSTEARGQASAAKPTTQRKDEEEGRGRALLSILIALIVAAAIYFLTKQGNQPASRPSPPAPAPVVEQVPLAPAPSADPAAPVPEQALSAAPFELEPVPAASAVDALSPPAPPEPEPEPAPAPKVAPARAPRPRPAPKPPAATSSTSATATPTPSTTPAPAAPTVQAPAVPAPAPTTPGASEAPAAP